MNEKILSWGAPSNSPENQTAGYTVSLPLSDRDRSLYWTLSRLCTPEPIGNNMHGVAKPEPVQIQLQMTQARSVVGKRFSKEQTLQRKACVSLPSTKSPFGSRITSFLLFFVMNIFGLYSPARQLGSELRRRSFFWLMPLEPCKT